MNSSRKMVVLGAFGGLAAVAAAGGSAFACTPDAVVGVKEGGDHLVSSGGKDGVRTPPLVRAGSTMIYAVKSFESGKQVFVEIENPYTGVRLPLGSGEGPSFEQPIAIPSDWYNSTANKPYRLYAYQHGNVNSRVSDVYIHGGRDYVAPLPTTTPVTTDVQPQQPVPAAAAIGTSENPTGSASQGVTAAPQAAAEAGVVAPATADTPPASQGGAGALTAPGQPTSVPVALGPPTQLGSNAPPASELWSGLKADGSVNLLGPAAGTTPPSGGVPAGGIALLGTGILALAGVAAEGARRRLVLSRVARRR